MPQKARQPDMDLTPGLPPAVAALDEAVRGISGVLETPEVLQLIVDRVRDLVGAQYAALGIVDESHEITAFITSGISAAQREAIGDLPHGRGLLGLIIRENRSYRIPKIAAHPESYGFPPHHPPMHSFLGVPVSVKEEVVGRLYLTNKQGAPEFSADDEALVETFALHAGIAIDSARLHEQVRRLAVFDERDRISRELHDSIIQSIYAVTLSLDDVPDLVEESPSEARERVDAAIDTLQGVIRDIRNFIFGLRPVLLDSGSLLEGLRILSDEIRRNTAINIEFEAGLDEDLPMTVVAELLAIAREALANVARHSGAQHAAVDVAVDDGTVRLTIVDDGRGLGLGSVPSGGHHGLGNMRARAEALGGTFTVNSGPARGTRIIVAVPRNGRPQRRSE
jgi:two-component system, NarL family, sensor histidine kinase DevS